MKTVNKLILKSFVGPILMAFFIVVFVLLMNFMWRYIDELVGKGLSLAVIAELMMYASITTIPMGLPLATLFASIMAMGDMGENNELLALKSSGISLLNILKPLTVLVLFIAVSSFFIANDLVPYSFKKMHAIIYDIRHQKQSLEFEDGIFFNGIEEMSIRVGSQNKRTKLLNDILIYDTRSSGGKMTTTVADSGYIKLSDDKKFLLVTLYHGETYEESRGREWYDNNALRHHIFERQEAVMPLEGFDFERSDASMFSNSMTKNINELGKDIDSVQVIVDQSINTINNQVIRDQLFVYNQNLLIDSLPQKKDTYDLNDSIIAMNEERRYEVLNSAIQSARNSMSMMNYDESSLKDNINKLYKDQNEWYKKFALPFSIVIFFLIGAPLGAIIRKGGLGMPVVISVAFFVIYYVISITGEKMSREGTIDAFIGTWISSFILLPVAIFLTYKATNDSPILNADWYIKIYNKVKHIIIKGYSLTKKRNTSSMNSSN